MPPGNPKSASLTASARVMKRAVVLATVALGLGCSDGTGPLPPSVASVGVSPSPVSLVPGGTQMLVAVAKAASGETLAGRSTTWSSSDESKVTVAGGLLTGVAVGAATVTASVEGVQASVNVDVKDGALVGPGGLTFTDVTGRLTVAVPANAVAQATSLTVEPAANPPASVRLVGGTAFSVGPAAVAFAQPVVITIAYDATLAPSGYSETGLQLYEVTGSGWQLIEGSTVNTDAKTVTGSVSRAGVFAVLARPKVETVTVTGSTASIAVLATQQLVATLRDVEGVQLTRAISWESSDPSVALVNGTGLVTAKSPGSATVTASSEGKSGSATIVVTIGPPAKLVPFAGNNQTVRPGTAIPNPPSMMVTDAAGFPVPGANVTFAVTAGGGTITGAVATTNSAGIAAVGSWTLGASVGVNSLSASAAGLEGSPFVFNATAAIPAPAAMVVAAGDNQSGNPGGALPVSPSVKVTDAEGEPAAGVVVQFSVASGGGSITGASATTGSNGIASAGTWTLGPAGGLNIVVATSPELPGVTVIFNASAGPPPAVKIEPSDGDGQSGTVDAFVGNPPSVLVTDANGNPVAGVAVTWTVGVGGGSVVGAGSVTDAVGVARVGGWRLGPAPGDNTLHATAEGLSGSPVIFRATGVAAAPSSMTLNAGNNQSAVAGQAVAVRPSVKIINTSGNPVAGVAVTFTVVGGDGSVTGGSVVSDAGGIATVGSWILGASGNWLIASAPGLTGSPVLFTATGTAELVQIVTFGDSNTDLGYQGTQAEPSVASYVSTANSSIRLAAGAPHSALQLAGKIEARWKANSSKSIKVANHGIAGTSTGTGRSGVGAPHGLEQVGGVSRFRGEVMGDAYPWSGGEPVNAVYPTGAIQRTQAFVPRSTDFAYVSMGTNDIGAGVPTATIAGNLAAMISEWTGRGLPAGRLMITTIPPRRPGAESANIPDLNAKIRALASSTGARLIDLAAFVSEGDGLTWKPGMRVDSDQYLHYSEAVRDWLADQVVAVMLSF